LSFEAGYHPATTPTKTERVNPAPEQGSIRLVRRGLIPSRGRADSLKGLPKARAWESMVAKGRFAMRPGITARRDYDAARLRGLARTTKSASQGRRLLALAEIYDGGSRTKAACVGGVGLQTIRDWVLRFNAHGPEGLADHQAPGHPGKLNTAQREALAAMVESGPMPAIHGVVRWRLKTWRCGSGRSSGSR